MAYDILTQQDSPFGDGIGPAGVLLSIFGYFLAPAAIGAFVGVVYVATSELSARAIERRIEARLAQMQASKAIAPPSSSAAAAQDPTNPGV